MTGDDLLDFEILKALDPDERDVVCEFLARRDLDAGAVLFDQGDPADGLVLIAGGRLRLESRRAGELGTVGRGRALGPFALAAPGGRECRSVAETPARVYVLTREAFLGLADSHPRTACRIAQAALREVGDAFREALDAAGGVDLLRSGQ